MRGSWVTPVLPSSHPHEKRAGTFLQASWVLLRDGAPLVGDHPGRQGRTGLCERPLLAGSAQAGAQVNLPQVRPPAGAPLASVAPNARQGLKELNRPRMKSFSPSPQPRPRARADLGDTQLSAPTPPPPQPRFRCSLYCPLPAPEPPGASISRSRICRIPIKHLGEISAAYK